MLIYFSLSLSLSLSSHFLFIRITFVKSRKCLGINNTTRRACALQLLLRAFLVPAFQYSISAHTRTVLLLLRSMHTCVCVCFARSRETNIISLYFNSAPLLRALLSPLLLFNKTPRPPGARLVHCFPDIYMKNLRHTFSPTPLISIKYYSLGRRGRYSSIQSSPTTRTRTRCTRRFSEKLIARSFLPGE